jgi:HSP20 family molecular chaperone IbpA
MRTTVLPFRNFYVKPFLLNLNQEDIDDQKNLQHAAWNDWPSQGYYLQEDQHAYFLSLDIPGIKKENLDIQIEHDQLMIKGKRKNPYFKKEDENFTTISRSFKLHNQIDQTKIQAKLEDGVVYLTLPKEEKSKARKIEILDQADSSNSNMIEE